MLCLTATPARFDECRILVYRSVLVHLALCDTLTKTPNVTTLQVSSHQMAGGNARSLPSIGLEFNHWKQPPMPDVPGASVSRPSSSSLG